MTTPRRTRSLLGSRSAGVDVGGRSADSARKIIKNQVVAPLRQPVVVSYGGKDYTLSPKQLHETADIDGMVQEAIDRSRQGNILDRVSRYATGGKVNANLAARVSYDQSAVKHFVNSSPARSTRIRSTRPSCPDGGAKLQQEAGQPGLAVETGADDGRDLRGSPVAGP